jgi:hypothetical protein
MSISLNFAVDGISRGCRRRGASAGGGFVCANVFAVQHSRSLCTRRSCMAVITKSNEVKGHRNVSIDIRPKKFGKDVQVVDSAHRLPSVLARHVGGCRPTSLEEMFSALGVEGHVEKSLDIKLLCVVHNRNSHCNVGIFWI